MRHLRPTILAAAVLLAAPVAQAQQPDSTSLSGRFVDAPFEQFAREVERQTPYRLFFAPPAVDSLRVTLTVDQQPLPAVLTQLLVPRGLHFAIDAARNVYITTGQALQTELPAGFFRPPAGAAEAEPGAAEARLSGFSPARPRPAVSVTKVYEVGSGRPDQAGKATVAGYLREAKTGVPAVGVTVYVEAAGVGTTTDQFGYYSLTLPRGRHTLQVRGLGVRTTQRFVSLRGDGKLDIEVEEDITPLKEVVIEADKDRNVAGMQMGLEQLDIKTIRQVPTAFGEADILRVVLTLPGVKSVGEGSTGLNVRGGAADQNLILYNGATIYNPAHLFGFFSAFNPDVIKGVELYKSAVPAKFGGRLSSVLDVAGREGNKKQFGASGGIGPLTSRLTLEGPILKEKASFIVSGRASYSDWILHRLPVRTYRESSAGFYDLSAHLSYDINDKNAVYATGYLSRDRFRLGADTTYRYQNQAASLKWKHVFGPKLYAVLSGAYSHYDYNVGSQRNPVTASDLGYRLRQLSGQLDFSYFLNPRHTVEFGLSSIRYGIRPGSLEPRGAESLVSPTVLAREQALESAVYVSDRYEVSPRLALTLGLRYSLFNNLGPAEVRQYAPGLPRTDASVTGTRPYGPGRVTATYHGPEWRLSARYALTVNSSVKASYNRTRQYLHMLSNTATMSPTDVWKLSDAHVRPQVGDQVALGFYRNFKDNTIEASVEGYYKQMHDFVDFKPGARLLLNPHIETDILNAEGKAYGVELLVKKLTGKLNGWVSYTYARSLVQVSSQTFAERINGGRFYPSNFDRPHDATLIGNFRVNRRFSTSLNVTYSTGRPITLPLARFYMSNAARVFYSERNGYRVPDYFRTDIGLNIEGNHKVRKLAHGSWTVGVYNLTGRKNAYSIYFKSENGRINGYQLSIFGQPIPTITYNFRF